MNFFTKLFNTLKNGSKAKNSIWFIINNIPNFKQIKLDIKWELVQYLVIMTTEWDVISQTGYRATLIATRNTKEEAVQYLHELQKIDRLYQGSYPNLFVRQAE